MGRSQKWPDLGSPISKIQDIRFVGTDDLIIFRKFHNFPWNIVAVARWESYFVVGSLDLTWWPDLTWPWAEIFTKVAEKMGGKVGWKPGGAARRPFFAILEKPEGGGGRSNAPPPPAGRGLTLASWGGLLQPHMSFLSWTLHHLEYRAEIFHSLWGVFCATFGKKKKNGMTKLSRHKRNNLRQISAKSWVNASWRGANDLNGYSWCDWCQCMTSCDRWPLHHMSFKVN